MPGVMGAGKKRSCGIYDFTPSVDSGSKSIHPHGIYHDTGLKAVRKVREQLELLRNDINIQDAAYIRA